MAGNARSDSPTLDECHNWGPDETPNLCRCGGACPSCLEKEEKDKAKKLKREMKEAEKELLKQDWSFYPSSLLNLAHHFRIHYLYGPDSRNAALAKDEIDSIMQEFITPKDCIDAVGVEYTKVSADVERLGAQKRQIKKRLKEATKDFMTAQTKHARGKGEKPSIEKVNHLIEKMIETMPLLREQERKLCAIQQKVYHRKFGSISIAPKRKAPASAASIVQSAPARRRSAAVEPQMQQQRSDSPELEIVSENITIRDPPVHQAAAAPATPRAPSPDPLPMYSGNPTPAPSGIFAHVRSQMSFQEPPRPESRSFTPHRGLTSAHRLLESPHPSRHVPLPCLERSLDNRGSEEEFLPPPSVAIPAHLQERCESVEPSAPFPMELDLFTAGPATPAPALAVPRARPASSMSGGPQGDGRIHTPNFLTADPSLSGRMATPMDHHQASGTLSISPMTRTTPGLLFGGSCTLLEDAMRDTGILNE